MNHVVFRRMLALFSLCLLCSACQIEGGVAEQPTPAEVQVVPPTAQPVQSQALAARNQTWTLGLTDKPDSLLPYQATAAEQRRAAPVTELLFPSPMLAEGGVYTTTGVLEVLPLLETGGAEIRKADVFLDASGMITTTTTEVITQVDQLVVTYRWNPDLNWSDGEPVTADDSVFAYEHFKANPDSDDVRNKLAQIASYTAIDEHTTQAVLLPDVTGPTYALNFWTPLPKHLLESATPEQWAEFAQQPVGYGPYMITQRETGAIRMAQNPYYKGAELVRPNFDILFAQNIDILRANIANGNLDAIYSERPTTDDIAALDGDASQGLLTATYAPTAVWEHIDFNLDIPALQDYHVRRAIGFGTNRQEIVQDLYGSHGAVLDSWVLPFQPEAAPADQLNRYEYNPDQARALLDEAGYSDPDGDGIRASPDGVTLTLQLLTTSDNQLRETIASRFREDMRAIGIDVELATIDAGELIAPGGPLYQRQFEMALYAWRAELNASGLTLWNCNAVPSPENNFQGENFAGWCFRDADMAIRRGSTSLNPDERRDLYLRQQQLWTQELPALPLFQRLSVAASAPDVTGVAPDTFAPITWNVAQWRKQ